MKPVTADDIFTLMDSYITSTALNAAMELGLFWYLDEGPMDLAGISQALDIPPNRCHYWLVLLSDAGLIEQVPGGYTLSTTGRTAILDAFSQDTWAFLAREARFRFPVFHKLALHIREPRSTWEAQGMAPPDYFANITESPEYARRFTRMLYEIHIPLAESLAETLDMDGVTMLMDLGGGSGVMSFALLRRYPHLTSVVVDTPNVCAAGREIAKENRLEDRISYHEADFLEDELPSGFDMVLQCDVGPYNEEFFIKLRDSINLGGRLVIVDHFAATDGSLPSYWTHWAFLVSLTNPDYSMRTIDDVRRSLEDAGYRYLFDRILPQEELYRWARDWMVIEARR
jgi:cyclopropane fatty-acyl-phospholipid synthase-like methyltransferase